MKAKGKRFRRRFPLNHMMLTWRHPRERPADEDSYLGLFAASDGVEWYYRYADAVWEDGEWLVDVDLWDAEDGLMYGLIAYMPFPDVPEGADKRVNK